MDISWDDAKLFLAIAETGSLSGAARRLKLGQPTVTRRLAMLEYTVGAALFRRSVEGAALTSAGERLLGPAKKMAEWAGELHRAAEAHDGAPRGLVRVTSSPFICFDFLAPFAGFLAQKHPGLRLEVLSSVQYLDLARGEADLALRATRALEPRSAAGALPGDRERGVRLEGAQGEAAPEADPAERCRGSPGARRSTPFRPTRSWRR